MKAARIWVIFKRLIKLTLWVGLFGTLAGLVALWAVWTHFESGLPDVEQLRTAYRPPQVTRILARDGSELAQIYTERRTVIPVAGLPAHVKVAFLAAEDAHFYEHEGLNYFGLARAVLVNLRAGRMVQGGSTITQQVCKNVLLVPARTLKRKVQETMLAQRLERTLSKDDILGLYLNHIYLGHGRYGIEEAARFYFGKKATELDLPEAATLAGIVASPERYSPRRNARFALDRRRFVLRQMANKGFVSAEQEQAAEQAPLRLAPAPEDESALAPEMVEHARRLLESSAGESYRHGGYTVRTTLEPALQTAARQAVRDNIEAYAHRAKLEAPFSKGRRPFGPVFVGVPRRYHAYVGKVVAVDDAAGTLDLQVGTVLGRLRLSQETQANPKHLSPSQFAELDATLRVQLEGELETPHPELRLAIHPQSALVAIDVRTRDVVALVGGLSAVTGGLDRATRSRRQPGSSFKPFLYSYALHSRRFTPASVLELPPDPKHGPEPRTMRVREAITKSDNAAAGRLLEAVGSENVVGWAHAAGIDSPLSPTPSLALGAYEVTPLELTNAYVTFASGGVFSPPRLITQMTGPGGRELELAPAPLPRRVMTEEEAYLTTSLMRSVVESGTAMAARRLGRPVVGKTGTTNSAKDVWFVGYCPELVVGVWVGYDDPLSLGANDTGGSTALPAFIAFMKAALGSQPATAFPRPAGIQLERIDPKTGLLAEEGQVDAIEEEFLAGTAPVERAAPVPDADAGLPPDSGAPAVAPEASAAEGPPPAHPPAELPAE